MIYELRVLMTVAEALEIYLRGDYPEPHICFSSQSIRRRSLIAYHSNIV
jgi:hypothetical protein